MTSAEEEEDYMADLSKFIPPSNGSFPSKSSSKKVSIIKDSSSDCSFKKSKIITNRHEQKKLKREHQQIIEDQQTLENLKTSIPQSNIGFKLLKQMGYEPGSSLGKEGSGKIDPVQIEIRRGRGGLGKEDEKVVKMRKEKVKVERKMRDEQELLEEFGYRQKERWKGKKITINFRKAEAALAQLENREVEEVEKKDNEEEEKEDEEEEEITEEDLLVILMKLREEHNYCLFCGCQYVSEEDIVSNCPGINEDDH